MGTAFSGDGPIKVAVVTGRHAFDVPGLHALFRRMHDVDPYFQHVRNLAADQGGVREDYDVILFYHWHKQTPAGDWPAELGRPALDALGQTDQGIVVLHHALLCHDGWPPWTALTGIPDRSVEVRHGETLHVEIADPDHPITRGLAAWDIVDEPYRMAEPDADSRRLLTTDHPHSMQTLAWTRRYRASRVFCLELGHDDVAYTNPNFQTVLHRGISWCAREI
ncbi:MAG: ThuA domain-containing protein [Planctomycetota bacterium]